MFLICGSPENIDSAVLHTKRTSASIFFPLQSKIFVLYKTVISDPFQIMFSNA